MLRQNLSHCHADHAIASSAVIAVATPELGGDAASGPDPIIRRRPDGSINFDHYNRVARDLRAGDQQAALKILFAPAHWLVGALRPHPSIGMRSPYGS